MTLETWIIVWLQIGAVCVAVALVSRPGIHAAIRQPLLRGTLLMLPVLICLNAASWRDNLVLPPPPIAFATPAAQLVEANAPADVTIVSPGAGATSRPATLGLGQILTLGWAAVALVLFGRVMLGLRAGRRLARDSRPCQDPRVLAYKALGDVEVRVGRGVLEPLVSGVLRPRIYLPESALKELSDEQLRSILVHELAHVRHRDLVWRFFGRLLGCLLWPQPLIALLNRAMTRCDEERCDQEVIASGISVPEYANFLVTLAERSRGYRVGVTSIGFSSGLGQRVRRLLSRGLPAPRQMTFALRACLGVGHALALGSVIFAIGASGLEGQGVGDWKPLARKLTMRILEPDGTPMKSGVVWAEYASIDLVRTHVQLRVSDGAVEIDPAKVPGSYFVSLLAKSDTSAYTFGSAWDGSKATDTLTLRKSTTVKGRILLPNGSPGQDVDLVSTLLIYQNGQGRPGFIQMPPALQTIAKTDATGRFSTDVFSEGLTFRLDCPQLVTTADEFRNIEIKTENFDAGDIRFRVGAIIDGRVLRDGKPVSGITVGAQSDNQWGSAVTDALGQYSIRRLAPDSYNVALSLTDSQQHEFTALAHVGKPVASGERLAGIDFDLIPGAVIRGSVKGVDGKPREGIQVGVYGPAHPRSGAWVQTTRTDRKGEFMTRVPGGAQYVYIMEDLTAFGDSGSSAEVEVQDGQEIRVHLRYPK